MRDFKQPDASKMSSKLLSDRMKYLKSTDEEVTKMCNIVEEYSSKRYAEGLRLDEQLGEWIGEQIGKQIGKRKTMLKCIKNLMQSKQLSVLEAMDALCRSVKVFL